MTLQQRRAAWVVALLALASAGILAFYSAWALIGSQRAVDHALELRRATAETLSLLKDAETGQRGYLLTQQRPYLTPHEYASAHMGEQLRLLRRLVQSDPEQARMVTRVAELVASKMSELDLTLRLAQSGERERALSIVAEGSGWRDMVALREQLGQLLQHATRELDSHRAAHEERLAQTTFALVACLVLALVCGLGGLWTAERDIRVAKLRAAEVESSELSLRVLADHTSDLVRVLDARGRTVYASPSCSSLLQYSVEELMALPPESLVHPDDQAKWAQLLESARGAAADGGLLLHRMHAKDGAVRWFETRVQAAIGYSQPGCLHVTSHDVTERKLAANALRSQTERLESELASIGDGLVVVDAERRFRSINAAAREFFHVAEGDSSTERWSVKNRAFLPDGLTAFPPERGPITRALSGEAVSGVQMLIYDREGRPRMFEVSARPLRDGEQITGCVAFFHEITAQQKAARELRESEQRFRVLSDASFEGVAITQTGIVVDVNANFARFLGREPAELLGRVGLDLFAPEDRDHVNQASVESGKVFEARMLRRDGTRFPVEVRGREATLLGEPVRLAVIRDVTEKRAQEAELARHAELLRAQSLRDDLTGLYNRRGFYELATKQLILATRQRSFVCLFFVDLNGMKAINDGLGHEAGDRALVAAACALSRAFRDADVISRLGGDEFVVLASDCGASDVAAVCGRVQAAVAEYNASSSEPFRLAMSVGATVFDPHAPVTLETLLAAGDASMYEQKIASSDVAPRDRARPPAQDDDGDERKAL